MENEVSKSTINIIATVQQDGGIGVGDDHLWDFVENTRNWMNVTKNSAYIMGRKTFEIQNKKGNIPFFMKGRTLKVITSNRRYPIPRGAYRMISVMGAVQCVLDHDEEMDIFIAGGEAVYKEAFSDLLHLVKNIHLIRVDGNKEGATCFFPVFKPEELSKLGFSLQERGSDYLVSKQGKDVGVNYRHEIWSK